MVEGGGFEPPKASPSDLQSDPFDHSGTLPLLFMVPTVGIEPTTARLQVECSTVEPCRQLLLVMKKISRFFVNKYTLFF
jgi:hypothetical protein